MQKPITMNLSIRKMIHQAEMVVGVGFPTSDQPLLGRWPGPLGSLAQSCRDAAILSRLNSLDRIIGELP